MTLTVPLVGTHFNPPGKQILAILPGGQRLSLMAEPDNPYDPEALLVFVEGLAKLLDQMPPDRLVAFDESLDGSGFDLAEVREMAHQPVRLGHVGATGRGPCKKLGLPGTQEVHQMACDQAIEALQCALGFTPDGAPVVEITP